MATTLEMPELLTQAELLAVLKISRASLSPNPPKEGVGLAS